MAALRERIVNGTLKGGYFYTYHSHQPYLVQDGAVVGNLRKMWNAGDDKDRYEARMFYQCYLNPAQYVMRAVHEGKPNARCMVDFSGTLIEQFQAMDSDGLFAAEGKPGFVETYGQAFENHPDNLELLVIPWGHPYLDGGCPVRDFNRQIGRAVEQIKDVFGGRMRARLKGLFPPEVGLPSDPDALYELIVSCREWGLTWILVNETSLETPEGEGVGAGAPKTLYVKNRNGDEAHLTVLPKVHDIYQSEGGGHAAAKSNLHSRLGEWSGDDPLVIGSAGDLENGGVMMNEHWEPWLQTVVEGDEDPICPVTGTGFLEGLLAKHLGEADWSRAHEVFDRVHSKGGSWTYDSEHWTEGDNKQKLNTITEVLSGFHNDLTGKAGGPHPGNGMEDAWNASERALFVLETSCYRYWGDSGDWMEAGFALIEQCVQALNRFAETVRDPRRATIDDGQIAVA